MTASGRRGNQEGEEGRETDGRIGGGKRGRKGGKAIERRGTLGGDGRIEIRDARTDWAREKNKENLKCG